MNGVEYREKIRRIESDLTVAGAGIAGICAAVAAAREGLRVVLVNDRSVLGGNASSEIGIPMNGASHQGLNASIYAREGGLSEEIRLRMEAYNRGGGYDCLALLDAVYFDMIYEEKNITLLLNTGIFSCDVENGKICRCLARHAVSNVVFELVSPMYIDATGNGVLAFEAGAHYTKGREGKGDFHERKAPDEADSCTMGNTFYFETIDCGRKVTFTPPAFARNVKNMDFIKNINRPGYYRGLSVKGAHWSFEYGGQMDIIYDSEDIDLELRRLVYGIWDYIKNSGKYPEAENYALKRVYAKSGARESRRFLGDYVLTQNDIEEKRSFEDAVCVGGWPMDVHAPGGIYDPAPATDFIPVTGMYQIPFRCLYSRDIDNLMFAGRDVSVSHIALGSTRVMATCGCMGQAVGTAAACCKELQTTPRKLASDHCRMLQDRLVRADQTILGYVDSGRLTDCFTASADSEKRFENTEIFLRRRLDMNLGLALMMETDRLESISVWLRNTTDVDQILGYVILEGDHRETFLPERRTQRRDCTVPAGFSGWMSLRTDAQTGRDGKIYLVLEVNEALEVGMCRESLTGAVTLRLFPEGNCGTCNHDSVPLVPETGYRYLDHRYNREENIAFCGLIPEQRLYSAEKVLSPHGRPYGQPNVWIGEKGFPAVLTLTAKQQVKAGHLAFTFDTDLTKEPLDGLPDCLARDFDVTVIYRNASGERSVVWQVRDNWRRHVVFELEGDEILQVRLSILRSWGADAAGVYGAAFW